MFHSQRKKPPQNNDRATSCGLLLRILHVKKSPQNPHTDPLAEPGQRVSLGFLRNERSDLPCERGPRVEVLTDRGYNHTHYAAAISILYPCRGRHYYITHLQSKDYYRSKQNLL